MFSDAIVAIDGSKFKASNNKSNNYTSKKVQSHIERVEKHISRYLTELDQCDDKEKESYTAPIEEKLTWLKTRLVELHLLKNKVEDHPDKQISTTTHDLNFRSEWFNKSINGQVILSLISDFERC